MGPKLDILPFCRGQVCITSFPWYCTGLQLRTFNVWHLVELKPRKKLWLKLGPNRPNRGRYEIFEHFLSYFLTERTETMKVLGITFNKHLDWTIKWFNEAASPIHTAILSLELLMVYQNQFVIQKHWTVSKQKPLLT